MWFPALRLPPRLRSGLRHNRAGSCAKDAQRLVHPADYGAVRTPCVAGGGVDKHGVLRLHFVIGFANNKVPLRMTGLKRVPISQHTDGSGERQSPLCDQCGSHSCAKNAQEWGTLCSAERVFEQTVKVELFCLYSQEDVVTGLICLHRATYLKDLIDRCQPVLSLSGDDEF